MTFSVRHPPQRSGLEYVARAVSKCSPWDGARQRVFATALLLSCASCHKKPTHVWTCLGPTASKLNPRSSCSCIKFNLLFDAREAPEERLCLEKYECCVITTEVTESQAALTRCDCWNPSQGGPTCESKISPPGQENFMWKQVDRCERW